MDTYYKKKRRKAGLAPSDMAKELGVDCKKYSLIENGVVKMPKNLINKFNEIVNKGKNEHTLERLNNEQVVNDFWNDMKIKVDGQYNLKRKMKEFNIDTFRELSKLVGVSNSNISHYLSADWEAPYDFKNTIYLFFQDELNIQVPKKSAVAKKTTYKIEKKTSDRVSPKQCHNQELIDYYNNLDLATFVKERNITAQGLAKAIGLHQDSVRRMITKETTIPSEKTILKIKNYMESLEEKPSTQVEFYQFIADAEEKCDKTPVETVEKCDEEGDIRRRYQQEIEENNVIIETYQGIINNLLNRNRVCEEVLKVIDELRGE